MVADFGVSEALESDENRRATRWGTVNWYIPFLSLIAFVECVSYIFLIVVSLMNAF